VPFTRTRSRGPSTSRCRASRSRWSQPRRIRGSRAGRCWRCWARTTSAPRARRA
jgi:hypothetical protein